MDKWKLVSKEAVDSQKLAERAERKVIGAALQLAKACKAPAESFAFQFQSSEPFFCIERALFFKRPDLALCGKSLLGASLKAPREPQGLNLEQSAFGREVNEELKAKVTKNSRTLYTFFIPPQGLSSALANRCAAHEQVHRVAQRHERACVFAAQSQQALLTFVIEPHFAKAPLLLAALDRALSHALLEHEELFKHCIAKDNSVLQGRGMQSSDWAASADPYFPWIAASCAIADSVSLFADEIADAAHRHPDKTKPFLFLTIDSIFDRASLTRSPQPHWAGLPLLLPKTIRAFDSVLSASQLQQVCDREGAFHAKRGIEEAQVIIDLFSDQIAPAVKADLRRVPTLAPLLEAANRAVDALASAMGQMSDLGWEAKLQVLHQVIAPRVQAVRQSIDPLEAQVGPAIWPLGTIQ